jgi:hypothetical protein
MTRLTLYPITDGEWRLLRATAGVQGDWHGTHADADQALAALVGELAG